MDEGGKQANLRKQEMALMRGIGICLLAFLAGLGLWAYNFVYTPRLHHLPPPPETVKAPPPPKPAAALAAPAAPPPIVQDISEPGPRYVHRGGSVLRDRPKTSGHVLKKEAKGARVILEALLEDGWARVTDGALAGYMRASVLGINPPE
jgi:hypothetical protein